MASPILDKILHDIKTAMRERDQETLIALRTLHSDIKNVGINERREPSDADVATVLAKSVKQRNESIEQFQKAGRNDLVAKEQFQMDLYKRYQPKQLERGEIEKIVQEAMDKTGIKEKKEMGKIMKEVMPLLKGRADGKLVNEIVSQKLV